MATFNDFGIEPLLEEYQELHPNITIEHKRAATSDEARENMYSKIAAGSGLADIEYVEIDWMPELRGYSQYLNDLADPAIEGRFIGWAEEGGKDAEGRQIAYPVNIAPEGICYRADLFEQAGLPTDRAEVAELFGGANATWAKYFEVGEQFVANSPGGAKWFDEAASIYQGMVNQLEYPYEDQDDNVIADTNPDVKAIFDQVTTAALDDGLSAGLQQWNDDWGQAFQNGAFATILCPSWILGPIQDYAAGVTGWDVANVFPGGGGNWGGSFLSIPTQTEHFDEAKALALWLTAPEQQVKTFENAGLFPATPDATTDPAVTEYSHTYFNNAPTGQIFAERAEAVKVMPYKGPHYFAVQNTAMIPALRRVDVDKTDTAQSSWDKFVAEIEQYK
ncbi:MAG: ABC transporter substrate-binding protein [Bifidobacteriaceae bacterium]|nr:ABC transporter substrate-binding protein [Bifidobacteriaceae bacterium]